MEYLSTHFSGYLSKYTIPVLNIDWNVPSTGGIFAGGLFSGIAWILSMMFTLLLVAWVGISIYAAVKIITSGGSDEMKKGMEMIKNIWLGISMGFGFFLVISFLGSFFGFGGIYDWTRSLAQCNGPTDNDLGGYYFKDVQEQKVIYELAGRKYSNGVYCCKYARFDPAYQVCIPSCPVHIDTYHMLEFNDGYHWIISVNGNPPDVENSAEFYDCRPY